jgi:hypothetical protein
MIDKAFADFVKQHLVTLDELARRYTEYRTDVIESWWSELSEHIRLRTPADYDFLDDKFLRQNRLAEGEHRCGWSRNLEVSGTQTLAAICFGVNVTVALLVGGLL